MTDSSSIQDSARGSLRLRPMTPADIPLGMRLKDAAGWNQTSEDWKNFLAMGPEGCFVAEWAGVPVGTFTTLDYGRVVGWIGMVLVDPEYRRRGIGTFLIENAVRALEGRCRTVKLDATPAGRKVYLPLGFKDELVLERRVRLGGDSPHREVDRRGSVAAARPTDFEQIAALDLEAFGANRGEILKRWLHGAPEYAFVSRAGSHLSGFCLGRHGSRYEHLGPLVAVDLASAESLLSRVLEAFRDRTVVIDVLAWNPRWLEKLESLDFRLERRLTRMSRGLEPPPDVVDWQWAAAGPEVG